MLKLWLFTDTHLFLRDPMPVQAPRTDQKCMLESAAILDAALAEFLDAPDCDILLLAGDLTCDGHAAEHRGMLERLHRVQAAGKRVLAITATHDCDQAKRGERNETGLPPLEHPESKVFREELPGLYYAFGARDAIARCEADGFSYVAQLAPGYRLLCLNDDGNGRGFCGFDENVMAWILAQIEDARAAGDYIFGMTHHPSLPPSPIYPIISKRDMLGDWEECTRTLANAGLRCLFTGHSHMLNIAPIVTPEGSPYWDINTSALCGYPGAYRVIELEDNLLRVRTQAIRDFAGEKNGLSARAYLQRHFDYLLRSIIESAANDIALLSRHAVGFSVAPEKVLKMKIPITLAGKFANKITAGGLGTLLLCRRKIPKEARPLLVKELFLEFVRNIFAGEESYSRETPVGQAVLAVAKRLEPILRKPLAKIGVTDLPAFMLSLIYDDSPDHWVEIDLEGGIPTCP
ncbi:MAG: metallophosphoesterase [Oscillospiraceae bacterium]|jgi:hypothetical protein|nr:metallophosphoesterase [Oscillospiraceae bacterium]